MQIGFKEDIKKAVKPNVLKQSQAEQKRDLIMTYYMMGVKQSKIAESLNVSRQYISKLKQDYIILSYVVRGQLEPSHIANILGIKEKAVLDVINKYQSYIQNYSN